MWRSYVKLKKIVLTIIASQLDDNEITRLREVFQKIDTVGDGVISLKEFKNGNKQ